MKDLLKYSVFAVIGVVSFLVFFYFSFPYNVLKETISVKASKETKLSITIGNLEPIFPLGFLAEDVNIDDPGGASVSIKSVEGRLGVFALFLGKVSAHLALTDKNNGYISLLGQLNVMNMVVKEIYLPSKIEVDAKNYNFGNLINFALSKYAKSSSMNPMVRPLLEKTKVTGRINADVDFKIDYEEYKKSIGIASIDLVSLNLDFPPSMMMPSQQFQEAKIKANFKNGLLVMDKSSKLISNQLKLLIEGNVTQKSRFEQSVIDMSLNLELENELKDQLGTILDAIAKRSTNGKVEIVIKGPLSPQPEIQIN